MKFSVFSLYVTLSSFLATSLTTTLNFQRCNSKDLSCLKNAIQDALPKLKDGISELGVPSLDPLLLPKMSFGGENILNIVQNYPNAVLHGFSYAIITDVSFDLEKGKLVLFASGSIAEMNSSYTAKGRLMILDVNGHGECMIRLERLKGTLKADLESYVKKNHTFLKVTNILMEFQCEHAVFQFNNVFDGNQQLSDNINQVMNDNWKEIFDEQCPAFLKAVGFSLKNLINKLFTKMPIHEMFLD